MAFIASIEDILFYLTWFSINMYLISLTGALIIYRAAKEYGIEPDCVTRFFSKRKSRLLIKLCYTIREEYISEYRDSYLYLLAFPFIAIFIEIAKAIQSTYHPIYRFAWYRVVFLLITAIYTLLTLLLKRKFDHFLSETCL